MAQTNILIVEDDLTTQEMARMVLDNAGYGVSVARSAEDADRVIRNLWPDIVLMDRELPGMDGLELTRRLKVAEETSGITIIAFSSLHATEDNEWAPAAGSDGFVHKPFTVRGLLQTVAWHVPARANRPIPDCSIQAGPMAQAQPATDAAWHTSAANGRRNSAANLLSGFMKMSMILSSLLLIAGANSASAQTTAQHTITFQVDAINQVGVIGAPVLVINAAVAGNAPTSV